MKKYLLALAFSTLMAAPALAYSGLTFNGSVNSNMLGGSASFAFGNSEAQGFSDSASNANSAFNGSGMNTSTTGAFDSGSKTQGHAGSMSAGSGAASAFGAFNSGNGIIGW